MSDLIEIGKIVKPQGIKGQVKAIPLTDNAFRFNKLKKAYIDGRLYTVDKVIIDNDNSIFIKFNEVPDRNKAEELRNKTVYVERSEAVDLPKGTYFIVDIVKCEVYTDGVKIGRITEVLNYGASDIYCMELNDKRKAMFPAVAKTLLKVDIQNKRIDLDKTSFDETVVYEDEQ